MNFLTTLLAVGGVTATWHNPLGWELGPSPDSFTTTTIAFSVDAKTDQTRRVPECIWKPLPSHWSCYVLAPMTPFTTVSDKLTAMTCWQPVDLVRGGWMVPTLTFVFLLIIRLFGLLLYLLCILWASMLIFGRWCPCPCVRRTLRRSAD